MSEHALSLFELNNLVKQSLSQCLPDEYWIQAELSDVRTNATGHCYLELLQKDPRGNNLIAKARSMVWVNVFRLLKPYFEESTGQPFVSGIKVQVKVTVDFHELYGYSLTIYDIDPSYTLGDMALRRREILKQLEEDGVLTLNKELEIPLLPRRVAVVSSATAAGFGDFGHQLQNNSGGYYFHAELFPAIMQGSQVEESVLRALDKILLRQEEFDVVVLIRGGGSASDLSGFDTYLLAAACAQYPLPIITGIGHERDDTVIDSVAHTRVKTPTAAAEFLISRMDEAASTLHALSKQLRESVLKRVSGAQLFLLSVKNDLKQAVTSLLVKEKHRMELLAQRVYHASPERILQRGYSITLKNGKAVTDASQVQAGDVLVTRLAKGELNLTPTSSAGLETERNVR